MAGRTLCRFGGKNRAREKRGKRFSRQTTPLHAFIHLFLSLNQSHSSCLFVAMETILPSRSLPCASFHFSPPRERFISWIWKRHIYYPCLPSWSEPWLPYPIAPWSYSNHTRILNVHYCETCRTISSDLTILPLPLYSIPLPLHSTVRFRFSKPERLKRTLLLRMWIFKNVFCLNTF